MFVSKQLLDSVFDGTRCSADFLHRLFRDKRTTKSTAFIALLALALEGSLGIEAIGVEAARMGVHSTFIYIYTVISATDIFQFKTNMTFAEVASKRVHTPPTGGAHGFITGTFVNIGADSPIWGQAEPRGRAQTPRALGRVFAAVLAACQGARPRVGTRGVGHERVAARAKAPVGPVSVHTPVLARPGFPSALVHVLTAAFPGVSWEASAFVWAHTLPKLACRFTRSFTDALAVPPPAIAAGQPGSVATDSRLESGW